jgi:hypothetical protein
MGYFDAILPKNTGTEILSMANESAESSARDARSARIAELENELAQIRERKAKLNTEADMGKYKFVYDADPSAYMGYKQNLRSAAQTEAIRKATEDATKLSNLQSQWKQNGIDMEVNNFDLASAQNEFNVAKGNNDKAGMESALLRIKQANAKKNRLNRENDILRSKLFKDLDVEDVKDTTDYSEFDNNIAGADDVTKLLGAVEATKKSITVDNVSIPKTQKAQFIVKKTKELDDLEAKIKASPLNAEKKEQQLAEINEAREALKGYGKPAGKGGQGVKLTPEEEKANAEKAVFNADGSMKNPAQLSKLGAKTLRAYQQKYGWNLKAGIDRADRDGNK